MAPIDKPSDIPPEEMADMEAVYRLISEGKRVTDPACWSASTMLRGGPAPDPGEVRRGGVGG